MGLRGSAMVGSSSWRRQKTVFNQLNTGKEWVANAAVLSCCSPSVCRVPPIHTVLAYCRTEIRTPSFESALSPHALPQYSVL